MVKKICGRKKMETKDYSLRKIVGWTGWDVLEWSRCSTPTPKCWKCGKKIRRDVKNLLQDEGLLGVDFFGKRKMDLMVNQRLEKWESSHWQIVGNRKTYRGRWIWEASWHQMVVDIIVAKRNSVEWLETDIMVAIFKKTLMWDYEIRYKLGSLGGW